jgi:predicted RNA-binding protein with TRAM domain
MANTSTFAFTNTTDLSTSVTITGIKPKTNYALIAEQPTFVESQNKTAPLDQGERMTFRCQDVDKVSTAQVIQNPGKVKNGVQYVVKLEEILRTADGEGNIIMDEPIVMYLTVRHQKSGNIRASHLDTIFKRLLGAMYDETAGEFRWNDLMRSALLPVED